MVRRVSLRRSLDLPTDKNPGARNIGLKGITIESVIARRERALSDPRYILQAEDFGQKGGGGSDGNPSSAAVGAGDASVRMQLRRFLGALDRASHDPLRRSALRHLAGGWWQRVVLDSLDVERVFDYGRWWLVAVW